MRLTSVPIIAVALIAAGRVSATPASNLTPNAVRAAPGRVVLADGQSAAGVELDRTWDGRFCRSKLVNRGTAPVNVHEVVLFTVPHQLPPETPLYAEGFQMLSQTGGTLGKPVNVGGHTDRGHYKMPEPKDATVAYGLLTLSPAGADHLVFAFTSCRRFVGKLHARATSVEAVIDGENLTLAPGETWELEEFTAAAGPDRDALLGELADRIQTHHPRLTFNPVPTGWCSWYCFGPRVTAAQVLANLDFTAQNLPRLKYVQIDDGYQPAMGDWLDTGPAFGGGVQNVLRQIRAAGYEPAIWVAPFVAEEKSKLFREHPDWFIRDDDGKPLPSNKVTFGGWRRGPWYVLDGTHPNVQKHFESLFRTMRTEWGCTYFKLDANFWGAIHGGKFHDPKATRVEAYRRGMAAVLRGTGDAFVLGCNHPIWASLGLIHGSRSSGDIKRTWDKFARTARENFGRGWQNGRLWWNDPDAVTLSDAKPPLTDDEYRFHATAIYATGGMLLSGDDLPKLPPARLAMLRKLLPPTGVAAKFDDDALRVGRVEAGGKLMLCLFNWDDAPRDVSCRLPAACRVADVWAGDDLGRHEGTLMVPALPPHSGRLLACTPEPRRP
jgi:alpha-galactosidase